MRNARIIRVLRTLRALESRRHTFAELGKVLDCSTRQARRYVDALEEAYEPVRIEYVWYSTAIVWIERRA